MTRAASPLRFTKALFHPFDVHPVFFHHPAWGFPGGSTHGGPDAPEAFMSDIGGLLLMAL